jgi:uncharacterized membrane protein (DUF485 family)
MTLFQPHRGTVASTPAPQVGRESVASTPAPQVGRGSASGYEAVRASRDFWTIRRRFGSFVGPACTLFILWYFLFVIVALFAPGFMRISVFGDLKVGLCFGLLQFASTFAIAAAYCRWARRRLDPLADRLRHRLEGGRGQ